MRQEESVNELLAAMTYQHGELEEQDVIDRRGVSVLRCRSYSSCELILFRLIIICQAARHLDICFEQRWPERMAPRQQAECVIIRSVNKASGLSSITSV